MNQKKKYSIKAKRNSAENFEKVYVESLSE